jgi:L-lactate utilization protein LutB
VAGEADRVTELEQRIAELKRRWPAHSVSPALFEQLDELERQLAEALAAKQEQCQNK